MDVNDDVQQKRLVEPTSDDDVQDDSPDRASGADAGARDDGPELFETVGPHDKSNAMPGPIVEKIRSYDAPETNDHGVPVDGTWGDVTLPEMQLPGFGGKRYEDCGDELPHACKTCGHVVGVGRTCGTSTCSRCASTWCRERATRWCARLMQLKGLRYHVTGQDQHYHHLTISPPDMWAVDNADPREAGREVVREIMSELGVEGVALYHPYRGKNEDPAEDAPHPVEKYDFEGDGPATGDDRGEWKSRIFEGRDWDDVRDELKFDPHWHVVCVGGFVRGGQLTKAVEDATGWVIHRITPPEDDIKYSIKDDSALASVLAYVYSHTGIRETDAGHHRVETLHTGEHLTSRSFDVAEETEERADKLVREEAWRVLGIPSASMSCLKDHLQPPEDDEDEEHYGADGDDDGDPSEDGLRLTCGGGLVAIDEYDEDADDLFWRARLEDDDWREDARFDSDVARALAEWLQEQQPDRPIIDVVEAG